MAGHIAKRCGCRDETTGKQFGSKCSQLSKGDHGQYWVRYEAPPDGNGKRRRPWAGPYPNKRAAGKALTQIEAAVDNGLPIPDPNLRVDAYLDQWLKGKKKLKASTLESYEETVRLYGKPGLGHLKLASLREHHLSDLYDAMLQINNLPEGERPSEMLRRLLAARALAPWKFARPGKERGLKRQQPLSPARIQRVHRVLSSALGTAYKQRLIAHNPAPNVELPTVKKTRPLVWTEERVERWQETGRVPGPVMVWTPAQCGAFLDAAEKRAERLYPLFHLVATRGLRRGEVCGARRADLDVARAMTLTVLESGDDGDDGLKSEHSQRTVALDAQNVALLKAWRTRQREERLASGAGWVDSGLVFTGADGAALREEYVSERFVAVVKAAGLPPIRFHDLRHCAATLMLAAGVDMKVVSATLGHARYAFTADVYASVVPEVATAAAEATAAIIPRNRLSGGG